MKIISYHYSDSGFWFRVFGYGASIINRNKEPEPFSIRYGYRKELRIGRYGIKTLKP